MGVRLPILCLVLALAAFAAGCGGGGESGGGESAGGGESSGGAPGEVVMEGIEFRPADITVSVGDTVTWTNGEDVGHDVTKEDGPGEDFSSGEAGGMREVDTFEHTFEQAGTIDYVCTVHSGMTGTVTVEQ